MTFRARDQNLVIFEFEAATVEDAIKHLSDYETKNKVSTRCFEKSTGKRIIGGILQISKPL
jgi:light-regulated signal transduction histidine kinase (bacteriophytochrome)